MSTASAAVVGVDRTAHPLLSRLSDYLELSKPRIIVLELVVAAAAACVAAPHGLDRWVLLQALGGTALVAASASAANQLFERRRDRQMRRTAQRPVAAGRVSTMEATLLSAGSLIVGVVWLAVGVNGLTACLGGATWVLYALVYTPLKRRTPLNTAVGAVAGALPMLMGWTATGTPLDMRAMAMACVLFLWQFPHFMAIAWLYRRQYDQAGFKMLSVVDPSGVRAGAQAVLGSALLIPVSLIPALQPSSGSPLVYAIWSVLLGGGLFAAALRFALSRNEEAAKPLLRMSLIYLPAWLAMLVAVSV